MCLVSAVFHGIYATLCFMQSSFQGKNWATNRLSADMDGLLLNTETFYTIVQKQILAKYGKEFTWDLKAQVCYQILTTENNHAVNCSCQ